MKLYVLDLGKIVMKGANPVLDEPDAEAAIPIHRVKVRPLERAVQCSENHGRSFHTHLF